ncbi:MAG: VanZ family protein [Lachnospiraceae bacterium]|nr:VanZ family protein [Lachnospiraceae bacterium]
MQKKEKTRLALFIAYSLIMLVMLFLRPVTGTDTMSYGENVWSRFNPVPFETIVYFHKILTYNLPFSVFAQVVANLVGNVLLFIPFGFFLVGIKTGTRRSFPKVMLISAVVISVIELTQMFTLRGYCDIDDLILNEAGVALGYLSRKIFS